MCFCCCFFHAKLPSIVNERMNFTSSFFWLQTGKKTLVASLVRLPDNYLHLTESERVLRNEQYFSELIDLYQSKGKHKKGK